MTHHPGRARAHQRQRDHQQQRGALVQRAGRRGARRGAGDREPVLPGATRRRWTSRAQRLARALPPAAVAAGDDRRAISPLLEDELQTMRDGMIESTRRRPSPGGPPTSRFVVAARVADAAQRSRPRLGRSAGAQRGGRPAATSRRERRARQRRRAPARGVARSSTRTARSSARSSSSQHIERRRSTSMRRAATAAYERYKACEVLQAPIQGIYLSIFLAVTLLILISATWLGLYLAKRITRPVQQLAEGARAIGAGHLDVRLEPETGDELGLARRSVQHDGGRAADQPREARAVAAATSSGRTSRWTRAAATSRRSSSAWRPASFRSTRRAASRRSTARRSACSALGPAAIGRPARECSAARTCAPLLPLVEATRRSAPGAASCRRSRWRARAARSISPRPRPCSPARPAGSEGAVLVLDDVTPLIRAQRVAAWRDVARRLAHEIKNPLTPIQLSAERLRRHFARRAAADAGAGRRVHRRDHRPRSRR